MLAPYGCSQLGARALCKALGENTKLLFLLRARRFCGNRQATSRCGPTSPLTHSPITHSPITHSRSQPPAPTHYALTPARLTTHATPPVATPLATSSRRQEAEWSDDGQSDRMPRLLKFRALCAHCEKAEAKAWAVNSRTPLCTNCAMAQSIDPVPIVSRTVVTALCTRCGLAPASSLAVAGGAPLCEICAAKWKTEVVPLRESDALGGIVFDKMDFSGLQGKGVGAVDAVGEDRVDLSYYQTKVPTSLVGDRKRAPEKDSNGTASKSPRRRRR